MYSSCIKEEIESQFTDSIIYPVPGYKDNENMWDFVCQIGIQRDKKSSTKYNSPEINPKSKECCKN